MKKTKITIIFSLIIIIFSTFYAYKYFIYKENIKILDSINETDLFYIKLVSSTLIENKSNFLKAKNEKLKKILENVDEKSIKYFQEKIEKDGKNKDYLYLEFLKIMEFEFQNKRS